MESCEQKKKSYFFSIKKKAKEFEINFEKKIYFSSNFCLKFVINYIFLLANSSFFIAKNNRL